MAAQENIETSIAIVVNPRSGKGRAEKTGMWLVQKLSERKITHALFSSNWPSNFDGFTEVWIVGGDGTMNYFVNAYKNINLDRKSVV